MVDFLTENIVVLLGLAICQYYFFYKLRQDLEFRLQNIHHDIDNYRDTQQPQMVHAVGTISQRIYSERLEQVQREFTQRLIMSETVIRQDIQQLDVRGREAHNAVATVRQNVSRLSEPMNTILARTATIENTVHSLSSNIDKLSNAKHALTTEVKALNKEVRDQRKREAENHTSLEASLNTLSDTIKKNHDIMKEGIEEVDNLSVGRDNVLAKSQEHARQTLLALEEVFCPPKDGQTDGAQSEQSQGEESGPAPRASTPAATQSEASQPGAAPATGVPEKEEEKEEDL